MDSQFQPGRQQPDVMPPGEVLLEARGITKRYAGEGGAHGAQPPLVLDTIDAQVNAGEFLALLGPSGSGKSTLMRILAGLLQPTTGEVAFKGSPQHGPNPNVAMVFQSFALFPWLTVLQNVELGLQSRDLPRTQMLKRALAAIDLIGLDGFEDAFPKELSGGMRQRVGFARALVVEPEMLFMDEPFSALDVLTAANLRKELMALWHSRNVPTRAMVMVTHNIDDAVSMADRILVLGTNPGHIRVELAGLPLDKRTTVCPEHTERVDLIYKIMTSPQEDIAMLVPTPTPGITTGPLVVPPRHYQVLPHTGIGDLTGLIELVYAHGGRDDLYDLGRRLHLELDDLLPLVDATDLLGFADTEQGDLVLTEQGKRFAEANVLDEKELFRTQALARIAKLRQIMQALEASESHTVDEQVFLKQMEAYFSQKEARAQLDTAVDWGRYAEIFAYQDESGIFRLEDGTQGA
jgi:NitT/TauT family transport system ATP-binding protein